MWMEIPWWGALLAVLALQIGLFAVRDQVHEGLRRVWSALTRGLRFAGTWFRGAARDLDQRNRAMLTAEALREQELAIETEFERLNRGFVEHLARYPATQRKLEDAVSEVQAGLSACSEAPMAVPGWPDAAEKLLAMPDVNEGSRKRLVNEVKKLAREGQKEALGVYRSESARRHKVLAAMDKYLGVDE
ncbi:MAG: hypothetical protein AAFX94_24315, partial [Myxococcota bacterium]